MPAPSTTSITIRSIDGRLLFAPQRRLTALFREASGRRVQGPRTFAMNPIVLIVETSCN